MAVLDSYKRLMSKSMETEIRLAIKKKADRQAIRVFSQNLRHLLLSPPLGSKRVMAIDPGPHDLDQPDLHPGGIPLIQLVGGAEGEEPGRLDLRGGLEDHGLDLLLLGQRRAEGDTALRRALRSSPASSARA